MSREENLPSVGLLLEYLQELGLGQREAWCLVSYVGDRVPQALELFSVASHDVWLGS